MQSETLKIAALQADLAWEDKQANLEKLDGLLGRVQSLTDVIVLPEMFSTGFSMNVKELAEPADGGETVKWMQEKARQYQSAVTGSIIVQAEDGSYRNRLFWVEPDSIAGHYDKRHLFTMAGEQHTFSPGTHRAVFEWQGWKICPVICYDLRFPVFLRNDIGYDAMIVVANWPERRSLHWRALLQARAIENQAYMVGVNRVGEDGNGVSHNGCSAIISPMGYFMGFAEYTESVLQATLEKHELEKTRRYMPFLNDADKFSIEL